MTKRIGIVFENKFTKIISKEDGYLYNDFSLVCWNDETKEIMMLGADAQKLLGNIEKPLRIINPILDGEIQDINIFTEMVHHILDPLKDNLKDAEIVIALPFEENKYNTSFIQSLFEKYHPNKIRFENTLLLAAAGFGTNIDDEYGTIVLDISYSKAHVGVIADGKIVASKSSNYAEEEIDKEINLYFYEKLGVTVGPDTIEKIKFNIGSVIKLRDKLELNIVAKDILTNEKKKIIIKDYDFKKIFTNLFTSYKSMITSVLENCPTHIRTGVIKNGLWITGRLAQVIGVKDFFEDFFDFPTKTSKLAGNAVIKGTIKIK